MKNRLQIIAGSLSLLALLVYTLVHTGGLLARYVAPAAVGYVAAAGIEIAIVSLSLRIGDLRRSGLSPRWFLFVLVSVVVVSALANVAEGFTAAKELPFTLSNVQTLDPVEAIIGLSATGLISLIVLALSEIIGTDVQSMAIEAEKNRRREQKQAEPHSIETARQIDLEQDAKNKKQIVSAMLNIYRNKPDARPIEIYKPLNIPRTTFYTYLNELEQAGTVIRNGTGIEVMN